MGHILQVWVPSSIAQALRKSQPELDESKAVQKILFTWWETELKARA